MPTKAATPEKNLEKAIRSAEPKMDEKELQEISEANKHFEEAIFNVKRVRASINDLRRIMVELIAIREVTDDANLQNAVGSIRTAVFNFLLQEHSFVDVISDLDENFF